jgi:O-antigen/teichoic acid export membrane protein
MKSKIAVLKNIAWASASQYITFIVRFLGSIYLARSIDPLYFGKQGLAVSIVVLFWSFVTIGEQPATIRQNENIVPYMRMQMSIRIWIVIVLSVIVSIAWLFKWLPVSTEISLYVVLLFASQIPAQITSIYYIYMIKQMMFKRLAVISVSSSVATVIIACILAYYNHPIVALLSLYMTEQLFVALLTVGLSPIRFGPKYDKQLASLFFHYAKYVLPSIQFDRLQNKIPDISIGTIISELQLSFYQRAMGLANLFQTLFMSGLIDYILPHFAKIQEDRLRVSRHFELVSSLMIRIIFGVFTLLAITLPALIVLIYGAKWLPSVIIFRIMLPFVVLQTFRVFMRNVHQVIGSVKSLVFAQIVELISLLVLLFPLMYWKGIIGVAIALNVSTIIGVALTIFSFKKFADFSVHRIFTNPFISAVAATLVVLVMGLVDDSTHKLGNAGILFFTFFGLYGGMLLLLEFKFVKQLFSEIGIIRSFRV